MNELSPELCLCLSGHNGDIICWHFLLAFFRDCLHHLDNRPLWYYLRSIKLLWRGTMETIDYLGFSRHCNDIYGSGRFVQPLCKKCSVMDLVYPPHGFYNYETKTFFARSVVIKWNFKRNSIWYKTSYQYLLSTYRIRLLYFSLSYIIELQYKLLSKLQ